MNEQRTPVLIPIQGARITLGKTAEEIYALVDSGELRWVWNISADAKNRALRFWSCELNGEPVRHLEPSAVVDRIVGHAHELEIRNEVVSRILWASTPTVLRLYRCGALAGRIESHALWILRVSLVEFLHCRLLHGQTAHVTSPAPENNR